MTARKKTAAPSRKRTSPTPSQRAAAKRRKIAAVSSATTVRTVMSHKVATVTGKTSLSQVAILLARKHISCVVVVKDGKPLGIVSERDLVQAIAKAHAVKSPGGKGAGRKTAGNGLTHLLENTPVSQVMSTPVEVLPACTPLDKAVTLMHEKGYRRFPIVDESGSLGGIVTQTDVLRTFSRELALAHDRMQDMATHDALTGLYNRRYFMDVLGRQFLVSRRYGDPMALIMLDLDDFKKVNDRHGHQFGDMVLREVSEILAHGRRTDLVARFGGEEFTVMAQKIDLANATKLAERMREAIAATGRTASFGVAYYPDPDTMNMEDLIRHADLAMYNAKQAGKNRVTVWSQEMEDFPRVRD
jgi:diguanylate cyclase (GGDEF)-like protein